MKKWRTKIFLLISIIGFAHLSILFTNKNLINDSKYHLNNYNTKTNINGVNNGLMYTILDNEASITGWDFSVNYPGYLNIPESINHEGVKYPVTSIADYAFTNHSTSQNAEENKQLGGEIKLPNTLKTIGQYAFARILTDNLAKKFTGEIKLPNSITKIGQRAFYNNSLSSVLVLPENLEILEYQVFSYNTFTDIKFNNGLQEIGDSNFYLFNIDTMFVSELIIPDSVKKIGPTAFLNYLKGITPKQKLILPRNIESISSSFKDCDSLVGATFLPDTLIVSDKNKYNVASDWDKSTGISSIIVKKGVSVAWSGSGLTTLKEVDLANGYVQIFKNQTDNVASLEDVSVKVDINDNVIVDANNPYVIPEFVIANNNDLMFAEGFVNYEWQKYENGRWVSFSSDKQINPNDYKFSNTDNIRLIATYNGKPVISNTFHINNGDNSEDNNGSGENNGSGDNSGNNGNGSGSGENNGSDDNSGNNGNGSGSGENNGSSDNNDNISNEKAPVVSQSWISQYYWVLIVAFASTLTIIFIVVFLIRYLNSKKSYYDEDVSI